MTATSSQRAEFTHREKVSEQPTSLDLPSTVTVVEGHAAASATVVVPLGALTGAYTITASAGEVSRSTPLTVTQVAPPGTLRIVAALPDPEVVRGSERPG